MAVLLSDLLIKGSNPLAIQGNTSPSAGPGTNLGGFATTGAIADTTLDNLFPDVTGIENSSGNIDYQCFFIFNNNGTQDLSLCFVFINSEIPGGVITAVGLDPIGMVPVGSGSSQAVIIPDKNTAPVGVAFTTANIAANGLALGNLVHGYCAALWVRRQCVQSVAINNDGTTIGIFATSPL